MPDTRPIPRVCMVAPEAYPVLNPGAGIRHVGGMEVQQVLVARGLAAKGHEMRFITRDHGQPDDERLDGIVVHKTCTESAGFPGTRFFYPRLPALWSALKRADADVYYVRGSGYTIAVVSAFARRFGRRAVFATAHDWDVDPVFRRLPTLRDEWLYRIGLRQADAVVVQTRHQQELLRNHARRDGHLIPSAVPIPDASAEDRDCLLWVAMFRTVKQPERFLDVARAFPRIPCIMVGGPVAGEERLYARVMKRAAGIPNLQLEGFRQPDQMARYFRRARALVSTSRLEGFPNTFLQAWSHGVPVVSLVDPDHVMTVNRLGVVAGDEGDLPRAVSSLLRRYAAPVPAVQRYVIAQHGLDESVERYHALFLSLCGRQLTGPAMAAANPPGPVAGRRH